MPENDIINSLKGILGDNADEKIGSVMNMLKSGISNNISSDSNIEESIQITDDKKTLPVSLGDNDINSASNDIFSLEGLEYMSKIKGIIDEMGSSNDPRSNLLMSLRPYMRDTRRKSIDSAVKILNLSRLSGVFKI